MTLREQNYPQDSIEANLQAETGNPKDHAMHIDNRLPSITFEQKQMGKIADGSAVTIKPLREPMAEPTLNNPDANQHSEFISDAVEKTEGRK